MSGNLFNDPRTSNIYYAIIIIYNIILLATFQQTPNVNNLHVLGEWDLSKILPYHQAF